MPYPHPGLDEGSHFLRVRVPRGRGCGPGLGGADHVAFFAWGSALAFDTRGRRLRELARAEEAPDHLDVRGQVPYEGLGGIAAIGRHANGAGGECCRDLVDDAAGQNTPRVLGDLAGVGPWFCARAREAHGQAELVARPAL